MIKYLHTTTRRITAVLSAGLLLQAGGCYFDRAELAAGLVSSIVNNLLGSYIFGAFNLIGP